MFYFFSIFSSGGTCLHEEGTILDFISIKWLPYTYMSVADFNFHQTCFGSDLHFVLQVPTSQKKEGVYDVPKSQPVSVSIFPIYMQ